MPRKPSRTGIVAAVTVAAAAAVGVVIPLAGAAPAHEHAGASGRTVVASASAGAEPRGGGAGEDSADAGVSSRGGPADGAADRRRHRQNGVGSLVLEGGAGAGAALVGGALLTGRGGRSGGTRESRRVGR
ncbi:hypothetical protein [Streptomyces sp. NPDC048650]|uniref:hypothetical protein n=1 Tax=unclassified Streptomyces TaxID=2593676 RepID=UPI00371CFAA4